MAMVDIVHSIHERPRQFVALLSKYLHTVCGLQLLLVVILGKGNERRMKCGLDILTIKGRFVFEHLPNGPSIPPQRVSFIFLRMNCDPFDAALVGRSQGHCLSVESY